MSNEGQSTTCALRQWVKVFLFARAVDGLGWRDGKWSTNGDYRHGSPSRSAQKKASSLYGATTDPVVLPKQGVTPKRERSQTTTINRHGVLRRRR
jgi:hypothetical protein